VGIAGGRPSSSYYFVGSQFDNPHHARPAIPLRPALQEPTAYSLNRETTPESDQPRTTTFTNICITALPRSDLPVICPVLPPPPTTPRSHPRLFKRSSLRHRTQARHQIIIRASHSPPPSQQYHHLQWQSSSQPRKRTIESFLGSGCSTNTTSRPTMLRSLRRFTASGYEKCPSVGLTQARELGFCVKMKWTGEVSGDGWESFSDLCSPSRTSHRRGRLIPMIICSE
jgi:hypothetical protein